MSAAKDLREENVQGCIRGLFTFALEVDELEMITNVCVKIFDAVPKDDERLKILETIFLEDESVMMLLPLLRMVVCTEGREHALLKDKAYTQFIEFAKRILSASKTKDELWTNKNSFFLMYWWGRIDDDAKHFAYEKLKQKKFFLLTIGHMINELAPRFFEQSDDESFYDMAHWGSQADFINLWFNLLVPLKMTELFRSASSGKISANDANVLRAFERIFPEVKSSTSE